MKTLGKFIAGVSAVSLALSLAVYGAIAVGVVKVIKYVKRRMNRG